MTEKTEATVTPALKRKTQFHAVILVGEDTFAETKTLSASKRKDLVKSLTAVGKHQLLGVFRGVKLEVETKTQYQIG